MSGAHGVAGWVWGGGGWVSVDRRLFRRFVASGWLWSCRVWSTAELGAMSSRMLLYIRPSIVCEHVYFVNMYYYIIIWWLPC